MRLNQSLLLLTILFALIAVASSQRLTTCIQVYIVVPGDTLNKIAISFGVSLNDLKKANPCITNPNLIFPGCIIRIPNRTKCF
ncbi:hypothetical protein RhiirC2_762085 [Rhizophagus irregularis]|uniref:Chitin-binding LysM effector n=1 Tax=Rhizophagus irregularis TaxID=588596 RepID=A0A2N1MEM7_9GLOM|nr:hypothetical protein RhiirC2_762085 [Rhizophagus irregularis]QFQ66279.1 chitin-binding LysM effector [Rhizophagus irregularis]